MNITCKESTEKVKGNYPCVKIRRDLNLIVLFVSERRGIILQSGTTCLPEGTLNEGFEEWVYEIWHGTLEIKV